MIKSPDSLRSVPEWFKTELRAVDPELRVRWSPRVLRWQIMRPRKSGEIPNALTRADTFERDWWEWVCVWTVSSPDGQKYADLDMRLIHAMRAGDLQKRDWRHILRDMEKGEEEIQRDRQRKLDDARASVAQVAADFATGKVTNVPSYEASVR